MAHDNFEAVPGAQTLGQLLGEEYGAMLAARTAERDHQILEAALLIVGDAGIHQRKDAGEKLVHGFLLIEIVDDRSVLAGESFEALFAAVIGETAAIAHKAAAVAAFGLRQALVERKTENTHDEVVRVGGKGLQFLGSQHAFESVHEGREGDGQPDVMKQPTEVFQCVGHALEEMNFALVEAAKTVGAQRLHDANVDVGVVVAQEGFAIERNETGDAVETEKIIFEIVQVPGDGLAVEAGDGIANLVIQIAASFDLETGQHGDNFAIGFDNLRSDGFACAIFGEKFEERGVAEVFLEIGAVGEAFGVNFRDGEAVAAKMFGE